MDSKVGIILGDVRGSLLMGGVFDREHYLKIVEEGANMLPDRFRIDQQNANQYVNDPSELLLKRKLIVLGDPPKFVKSFDSTNAANTPS